MLFFKEDGEGFVIVSEAKDMAQITLYLNRKCPFYKFYIRHHSHRCAETVLCCIQNNYIELVSAKPDKR